MPPSQHFAQLEEDAKALADASSITIDLDIQS